MPNELTYLNLRENLKLMLAMQGITYIFNTQKELNAINKFTMEGFTPDYVIELIGKLIKIKRHSKFGKDSFWQGCAVNLSDVYAYRVKIETVYFAIAFPEPISPTRVGVENFQPTNEPISTKKTWEDFLNWSKQLTRASQAEITKMTAVSDDKMILITGEPNDNLARTITAFFNDAGMSTVFKKPNGNENETATN